MNRLHLALVVLLLLGCSGPRPQPENALNRHLRLSADSRRDPALGQRWLASLSRRSGRERVELIDLRTNRAVPLAGLNRADTQPIDVSVNADGTRLAVVQQRQGRTELVLFQRPLGVVQRVPLDPPGVPRAVSLDGPGRQLAVQVSRDGRWQIDLIRWP